MPPAADLFEVHSGTEVDPCAVTDLEDALVAAQEALNRAEAHRAEIVNQMLRRAQAAERNDPDCGGAEFVSDHIATVLGCTRAAAAALLDTAAEAADHPSLMREWSAGRIDSRKVSTICNALRHVDRSFADSLAAQAIEYSRDHTAPQIRQWLDRRLLAADPSLARVRRGHAMSDRKVTLTPLADGMAELAAYLPAVQARQVFDTINTIAHAADSTDRRSMDQRRSDALVDVVVGRAEPPRVSVGVVVTAETLLELESEPGWVSGVGPVPAEEVRSLALSGGDVTWRKLLADSDSGALTGVGERGYRPSTRLDRAVRSRDMTCRFPGCRRSAVGNSAGTDLDHTEPWPTGKTAASNLAVLCRRHHRVKHSPGWDVSGSANDTMTWTTPGGHTVVTRPWEYLDRPPPPSD